MSSAKAPARLDNTERTSFVMDLHTVNARDWTPVRVIHHFKWITADNFPMDNLRARATLVFAGQISHCETEFICRRRAPDSGLALLQAAPVTDTDAAATTDESYSSESAAPAAAAPHEVVHDRTSGIVWSIPAARSRAPAAAAPAAAAAAAPPPALVMMMSPTRRDKAISRGGVCTVTVRVWRGDHQDDVGVMQVLKTERPPEEWTSIELQMTPEDRERCFAYQLARVGCMYNYNVQRNVIRSWFPCLRVVGPADDDDYSSGSGGGDDDGDGCVDSMQQRYHCGQLIAKSLRCTQLCLPGIDPSSCLPTQIHNALLELQQRFSAQRRYVQRQQQQQGPSLLGL